MGKIIVKDNALINASYNLDLVEQRLILLAIMEARESGRGINANDPLTVHAESYINQFNVHRVTAYQALKDACDDLFARQFSYQSKNKKGNIQNHRSRWVSEIIYVDTEASVKIIFAPAIVPLITRLEEHFTKYEIEQVSNLTSAYAIRMYELLICWRTTGKTPIIELNDFRSRMGVLEGEYQRIAHLKERIIEQAIKQINTHTDITVSYDQHKQGRIITGFSFKFKQKKIKKIIEEKNTFDLTDKQIPFFAHKLAHDSNFSSKYAKPGEEYLDIEKRLIQELQNEKFVKAVADDLIKLGFKK